MEDINIWKKGFLGKENQISAIFDKHLIDITGLI